MQDKLEKWIQEWEEFCEGENCHSEYRTARSLAEAMEKNGIARDLIRKILDEGLDRPL